MLKVGDKVRVRKDLAIGEVYGADSFEEDMEELSGKLVTLSRETYDGSWQVSESDYYFTPEMFDLSDEEGEKS